MCPDLLAPPAKPSCLVRGRRQSSIARLAPSWSQATFASAPQRTVTWRRTIQRINPTCIAVLAQAIAAPTFIGQAPGHAGNFEVIRRIGLADGRVVLAAIGLEPDAAGEYRVRSCNLIWAGQVDARRRTGRLKAPLP